ncbi:hypothetical protein [Lewinella sp. 4G2]|uniref:baeRF6 domain-containing protein n=1 Tax=Lewinella sp. 4G2 TaxID=1803372 RepID=UPI0007B4BB69|nr:hypothetical protein [Lewinella sp. 4G2]OAV44354.1 hypothetical protein A3850_007530 [Lewinella sp. 4G2]
MISQQTIDSLAQANGEHLVSLVVPTAQDNDSEKNRIRLKNALQEAKNELTKRGMNDRQAMEYLTKGTNLSEDFDFTQIDKAVALFIGDDIFEFVSLDEVANEAVTVGPEFELNSLLNTSSNSDHSFFLLALSRGGTKLFIAKDGTLQLIDATGIIPEDMEAALLLDDPDRQLNQAGRAGREGTYFGHGAGKDEESGHLKAYLDIVDQGVNTLLKNEKRPLLLAGVTEIVAIYRQANQYNHLIEDRYISGNVNDVPTQELFEQATVVLGDYFNEQQERDVELFGLNFAKGEAGASLDKIVPAAINGRVEVLWVKKGSRAFGSYDAATNGVNYLEEGDANAKDLFQTALRHTRKNGGRVYYVEADKMPKENTDVCAIYRYGTSAVTTNFN